MCACNTCRHISTGLAVAKPRLSGWDSGEGESLSTLTVIGVFRDGKWGLVGSWVLTRGGPLLQIGSYTRGGPLLQVGSYTRGGPLLQVGSC